MLSKSDEDILNDRLRNWGRWAADRPNLYGSTLLWRMMQLYGEDDPEAPKKAPEEPPVIEPIDIFDAVVVNRAWQSLPSRPYRYGKAKEVLVAHYCYPYVPIHIACRKLRIGVSEYVQLLTMAKYMIFNLIEKDAAKRLSASE